MNQEQIPTEKDALSFWKYNTWNKLLSNKSTSARVLSEGGGMLI